MKSRSFPSYAENIVLVGCATLFGAVVTVIPYLPVLVSMPDPLVDWFEKISMFLIIPGFIIAFFFRPSEASMHDMSERRMIIGNAVTWAIVFFFAMKRLRRRRVALAGAQETRESK